MNRLSFLMLLFGIYVFFANSFSVNYQPNVMVDPYAKLFFCWSPKCGSREAVDFVEHVTGYKQHPLHIDLTKRINGLMMNPDYAFYVMVRDPLTRVLSAYMDKYNDPSNPFNSYKLEGNFNNPKVTWQSITDTNPSKNNFKYFISILATRSDGTIAARDPHLMSQVQNCNLGRVNYTRVLQLERDHVEDAYANMPNFTEYKALYESLHSRHDKQSYHRHSNENLCRFLDEATAKKIFNLYRWDYVNFERMGLEGYSRNYSRYCPPPKL
mmetsp:Transcript_12178/g.18399  ORF Transcript_12178/g.18399 Transcript_12178/m.18399 type:complete len:268 (+) Transcript_12178:174-977(+)